MKKNFGTYYDRKNSKSYSKNGEYSSMNSQTYVSYPTDKTQVNTISPFTKNTLDSLFNHSPILHEYMKITNAIKSTNTHYLKQAKITSEKGISLDPDGYLPWKFMQILLNISLDHDDFNNTIIIIVNTAFYVTQLRKLIIFEK